MIKKILICFFIVSTIYSQNFKISGSIVNEETKEPIPYVNIRIAGTTQGTSSNLEGKYFLTIPVDNAKLIFTVVGYKKKEIEIKSTNQSKLNIMLVPEPIQFMEMVVGSDEDPAYRIVREAIKRKEVNKAGLKSLGYDFFSKDIILSAGQVALVSEKFSTGYYQSNKPEKIIVRSIHISENEKKHALAFDQNILNKIYVDFTDDTLMIVGSKVYLPLAYNAFEWYDYKLLEVKQSGSVHECYIEVIPKSTIQPLLAGKMVIEDSTFALKSVRFKNSAGIRFPYVNNLNIEFIQNRERYNNYWLPTYLKVESSLKMNFSNLIGIDKISMNQENMFSQYKINQDIPDSIYNLYATIKADSSKNPKVKFIKAVELSRTQIDSLRPIPLTASEVNAYKELDSTKSVITQVQFTGVFSSVATNAVNRTQNENSGNEFFKYIGKIFSILNFRDNRVDGLLIGARYSDSFFNNSVSWKGRLGYTFGRRDVEWRTDVTLKDFIFYNIEAELFDEATQWQMLNPYPDWLNSTNVILGFNDQFNYYRSSGIKFGIQNYFGRDISTSVEFIFDKQRSLPELKYQSIFNSNRFVRSNPLINEGNDYRFSVGLSIGKNPQEFQPIIQDGLLVQFDFSNPVLGSEFNYKRIRAIAQLTTKTLYGELFSSPYFVVGIEGGLITGDFGVQHIFTPNTALNIYSPFLSFKALSPYEFAGDKMLAVHAEHNWRTVPFQAIGLSFLSDLFIDLISGASALRVWNGASYLTNNSLNTIYWEGYISLSRILGVGRIDFAYSSQRNFVVRVGLSTLL